jgi:hypothetical protein
LTKRITAARWVRTVLLSCVSEACLDPVLAIFPIDHVGILLGLVGDIGLSSSASVGGNSSNSGAKLSNYGAAAGLAAFL